jgi:hypothetical protein
MNRSSVAVLVCVALLIVAFGAFVLLPRLLPSGEDDLGVGLLVAGSFLMVHVVLTGALGVACLFALRAWRRDPGQRTRINRLVIACGCAVVTLAILYAANFVWG